MDTLVGGGVTENEKSYGGRDEGFSRACGGNEIRNMYFQRV